MAIKTTAAEFDLRAPSIRKRNLQLPSDYLEVVERLLEYNHTTMSMLVHTLMSAIITGDITIDKSFRNLIWMHPGLTESLDVLTLTLRDREGNILNPTPTTEEMTDMFWGISDLYGEEE